MSRKKKSELAFELVQRTNCKANQNFAVANNPENDEKKLRLCNLISEEDCIKFTNVLSERGLLEKSCFRVHSGDMRKNKDTGEIETEMEHIHMALLFRTAQTYQSVSELFQEITGKVVPPSCVCSCTYADITSSRPSDEEQYALMVTYQTHAGKDGACTPEIAGYIENNKIPYKLVHHVHSMQWIDKETGETKEEVQDCLYFMPDIKPAPMNAEEVAFFTGDTSKLHQNLYNPDTLMTFNTDVLECFKIRQKISEHESEKAEARELQKQVDKVLDDIRDGLIPEYNYTLQVPKEIDRCMKNGQVANAYNYYYNKIKAELKAKGFKNIPARDVYFIEGGAGSGKSTLAQLLCEKNGLSYYVTSTGTHALDDYQGQEVIILDDCRDSSYRLNELLKMLDNNTQCDVQARYHNKNLCAVKLIIITSAKPLMEWYKEGYDRGEQMRQLYRRIKIHFTLEILPDGTRKCTEEVWNKRLNCYVVKDVEYFSNPDDVFEEEEGDSDILAETAMNQMRGAMEALGVKHWSGNSVSQSSPVAQPASVPSTAPDAQPQYSTALSEPVNNSLPVPNSQAGHSAQSEPEVYSPEWCRNRPIFYFDNAGRRFRLPCSVKEVEEAMRGIFGCDYTKDEYGITYVFDSWTDGESLNAIGEQLPTF